ncbi:MAG: hypothetical protein JZD41_06730 [Thermoproteus sp.]|nr:hypothetical protein [Thermoproteus sp.]
MCEIFWRLWEAGVEVVVGPLGWARAFGCNINSECECDAVVYSADLERVDGECVWAVDEPGFSHRRVWIGGLPHISLEDLPKVKSPYTQEVLECLTDALRRRGAGGRPRQAE